MKLFGFEFARLDDGNFVHKDIQYIEVSEDAYNYALQQFQNGELVCTVSRISKEGYKAFRSVSVDGNVLEAFKTGLLVMNSLHIDYDVVFNYYAVPSKTKDCVANDA